MSEHYRKAISNQTAKFPRKQPAQIQERVLAAIRGLPMDRDIKKLKRSLFYRLRVGKDRVVFETDHSEKIIYIQTIDNRGDIY